MNLFQAVFEPWYLRLLTWLRKGISVGCLSVLSIGTDYLPNLFSLFLFIPCLSCITIYLCSHRLKTGTHGWMREWERLQPNGTFKQLELFRNGMGCHVISPLLEVLRQGCCHLSRFGVGCWDRTLHFEMGLGRWLGGCSPLLNSVVSSEPLVPKGGLGLQSNHCSSLFPGTQCTSCSESHLLCCHFIFHSGPWHSNSLFILTILIPLW